MDPRRVRDHHDPTRSSSCIDPAVTRSCSSPDGLVGGCGDEAGPLVVGVVIPLIAPATEEALLVPYPSMLDIPHELVERVSWLIYARRRELRSRWRKLGCFKQALLTLAHLRKNETYQQIGAGFGVSEATAWRYVDETIEILASWAPGLHEALTGLGEDDHVIVDGTLIPTDRIAADEPYYSQKHRKHSKRGMNVQVIARPDGTPLWFSLRHRAAPASDECVCGGLVFSLR